MGVKKARDSDTRVTPTNGAHGLSRHEQTRWALVAATS
jgi:hypothetical protein